MMLKKVAGSQLLWMALVCLKFFLFFTNQQPTRRSFNLTLTIFNIFHSGKFFVTALRCSSGLQLALAGSIAGSSGLQLALAGSSWLQLALAGSSGLPAISLFASNHYEPARPSKSPLETARASQSPLKTARASQSLLEPAREAVSHSRNFFKSENFEKWLK